MSEFNKFKITEKDLPEKARKVISKMCRDRKWQMSIPPNEEDSDMVLVRVIDGFTNLKEENEKLRKTLFGCHKYIKEVPIDCGFVNEFLALTNTIEQCLGKETLGE